MAVLRRFSSQSGETIWATARQISPAKSRSGAMYSTDHQMLTKAASHAPAISPHGGIWKFRKTEVQPNQKTTAESPITTRPAAKGATPNASSGTISQLIKGPQ